MRRDRSIRFVPIAIVIVTAAVLIVVDNRVIRFVLGLPLVLFFPGFASVEAFFERDKMGGLERMLFSVGLSVAITATGGFLLNWTPWGLQVRSWALFLCLATAALWCIASMSRRGASWASPARSPTKIRVRDYVLFVLAAALLAFSVVVAYLGATGEPSPGFTQMWLMPVDATTPETVRLGVKNMEHQPTDYRVELLADNRPIQTWQSIVIASGDQWEITVPLASGTASSMPLEARLYRGGEPNTVYRRVTLSGR